jgi:hypothetical protein
MSYHLSESETMRVLEHPVDPAAAADRLTALLQEHPCTKAERDITVVVAVVER